MPQAFAARRGGGRGRADAGPDAGQARTPTLILPGKDDQRCPVTQAEALFVALMCGGQTPCEMVLNPGGSHRFLECGRPSHRLDATQRLIVCVARPSRRMQKTCASAPHHDDQHTLPSCAGTSLWPMVAKPA